MASGNQHKMSSQGPIGLLEGESKKKEIRGLVLVSKRAKPYLYRPEVYLLLT